MSGSVSKSKNDPSQSLQMIERPLMTPDELKSLPKGTFVVMKTGFYPMKVKLKLFFEWGIKFEEAYTVEENGNRQVAYANSTVLMDKIIDSYHPDFLDKPEIDEENSEKQSEKEGNPKVRTSPNSEQEVCETEVKSNEAQQPETTENKKPKVKQAPIRTERPAQNEVTENE